MPSWKVVGASARGPSHEESGHPCQDRFFSRTTGDLLTAVVSDGAGSAPKSAVGSEIAATVVCNGIFDAFTANPELRSFDLDHVRLRVVDSILAARDRLREAEGIPDGNGEDLSQYHATLLGVVAHAGGGVIFHIGDGAGVAFTDFPGGQQTISPPANGEYINETFFFTEYGWRGNLRLKPFAAPTLIMLATDGAASLAFVEKYTSAKDVILIPLTEYLLKAEGDVGERALARLLNRDDARAANDDDKTLLWAYLARD